MNTKKELFDELDGQQSRSSRLPTITTFQFPQLPLVQRWKNLTCRVLMASQLTF